jgi:hypothetical protein
MYLIQIQIKNVLILYYFVFYRLIPREMGPNNSEFGASSDIKWFQSPSKYNCGELNSDLSYQVQRQSLLKQLTFG